MPHKFLNRRAFLKTSLLGVSMLLCKPALSKGIDDDISYEGKLSLYNIHTDERLNITYRNTSGEYDTEALNALNRILRCHYTGQVADMDIRVIEFLNLVDKKLGGNKEIHIISGFRSYEYNQMLIERGRSVVRNSLHLMGKAIDINIPHVDLALLRRTALSLRYGGVGYYRSPNFVHLDSGRFRAW